MTAAPGSWPSRRRPSVVILAGGKGTRLAPLTTVLPKPLMPVGDGPIIDTLFRQLRSEGWREATLAVGHMSELMRTYCGSGTRYDLRLRYMYEDEPLGTVGALANLSEQKRSRSLLVSNGDVLTTLRFGDFVEAHAQSGAVLSIALYRRDVQIDFGVLELDGNLGPERRVLAYREKPSIQSTVSMGIYMMEPRALEYIVPGERLDLPELVQRLLDDGQPVAGYPFEGYWLDIGRHSDYQQALDDYEEMRPHLEHVAAPA